MLTLRLCAGLECLGCWLRCVQLLDSITYLLWASHDIPTQVHAQCCLISRKLLPIRYVLPPPASESECLAEQMLGDRPLPVCFYSFDNRLYT